jgi:ATP-dependent RNA helicase RhlE
MSFQKLGLRPDVLEGVNKQGYTTPTPIQEKAIPVILSGRDILAGAQTGTGKTAAFTLPLLHLLGENQSSPSRKPRALILAPTRELAAQVAESIKTYDGARRFRSAVIFGGVGAYPQIQALKKGVDVVTGTPGRLLDLCERKALDLSAIEYLILDEADRMLDMGFIHDIRKIIRKIPVKRQTLFFSATYSKEIKTLADTILKNPVLVEVARQNDTAEGIQQCLYAVEKSKKTSFLTQLIRKEKWSRVLVFTRTKHGANRLTKQLVANGIHAAAIHGQKSQNARTKALADFKNNKLVVLVATDIAARGLDIDKLPHVVNYELPDDAENYVHRIGRTGRAGCTGEAISLVSREEVKVLKAIERMIRKTIPVKVAEGMTPISLQESTPRPSQHKPSRAPGRYPRSGKPSASRNNRRRRHSGRASVGSHA